MAIGLLELLRSRISKKMKNQRKQLLLQDVKMDGSINFQTNGDINFFPCPWEDDKRVTDGKRVRYEGGIEVDADGRAHIKRWYRGTKGPKQDTLFETAHGVLKVTRPQINPSDGRRRMTTESVYVVFKFPKKYGLAMTRALYEAETEQIMSFMKSRREEAIWD